MQFPPHMCFILFQSLHVIFSVFGLTFLTLLLRENIEYRSYSRFALLYNKLHYSFSVYNALKACAGISTLANQIKPEKSLPFCLSFLGTGFLTFTLEGLVVQIWY